jgi:MoxR-like ATPase
MNVREILKTVLFTPGAKRRWGLPLIFVGPPGTGKTQRVEEEAARFGLATEIIIGSIREPTDVGGLARLEDDRFRLVPAAWAVELGTKKHGVVVLDELNTNVPAMQAALLRLATDGAVGEYMLPPAVRVLAMMNRAEEAAGGWDLSPPLANRFGHLKWDAPSVAEWSNWLLGGADAPATSPASAAVQLEAKVLKAWDAPFAKARGLVAGFLKAQP